MNNWETAKSSVGSNYPFDDTAYQVGLLTAGLDPDAEFQPGKAFDLAVAQLILFLITSADISEGGYSTKLDRDALMRVRQSLLDKWDDPTPSGGPTLRDRTYLW